MSIDLDALHAASTQGPWSKRKTRDGTFATTLQCGASAHFLEDSDAKFFVEVHNAWPCISAELAEAKEALRVCRAASKLNSEEAFHWGAKYAAEEKAHDSTMKLRDDHEEALNLIFSALGMDEHESEWSSANDPRAVAIERAEALVAGCEQVAELTMERDRFNAVTVAAVKQNCELMDKLVRAQKDAARLRSALEPFAAGAVIDSIERDDYSIMKDRIVDWHGPSDFKAAHAAFLATTPTAIHCGDATGAFDPSLCQFDPCHCEVAEADFIASGEVDGPDGL
jgi:hypothetical protein